MAVTVRIVDISPGHKSYRFQQPHSFTHWREAVPRVGEYLLDKNEFMYQIDAIVWYESYSVTVKVKRKEE